ncbi:hypothetical protein EOPP23_06305 [Endozoicomonas sp. OPT23]|uniref:hypothetical protein n=1 Tax=Endozoicomonas sp. OPT23 TaxID=2072845 RepID=UPI00129A8997|nr:hypothetical protein [Endozoicomonas sp. OPT23]MRI32598.1 hypothetical protein [Endozoicomonas sp. OPT23]
MNDGKVLKRFVTSGANSAKALEAFFACWRLGWVEHVSLTEQNVCSVLSDQQHQFMPHIFICDADVESIHLLRTALSNRSEGCQPIIILFGEKPALEMVDNQIGQIAGIPLNKITTVQDAQSLETVVECCAHISCGTSLVDVDFADISTWLDDGRVFVSAGMDDVSEAELPYRLYQHLPMRHTIDGKDYDTKAVVLVFTANPAFTLSVFDASVKMLRGCCGAEMLQIAHTNNHESQPTGFRLFMALQESEEQTSAMFGGFSSIGEYLDSFSKGAKSRD